MSAFRLQEGADLHRRSGSSVQQVHLKESIKSDLAGFNRRAFLKGGLLCAIGGSSILAGCSSSTSSVAKGFKVLSADTAAIFTKLIEVALPTAGTRLAPVSTIPVLANIDKTLSILDPSIRADLSLAVNLFDYSPTLLGLHFTRFQNLNNTEASQYLEGWQNAGSIQRGIATALKKIVYASYWRDERTWSAIEFDGAVSDTWGLKALGNAPMPVSKSVPENKRSTAEAKGYE